MYIDVKCELLYIVHMVKMSSMCAEISPKHHCTEKSGGQKNNNEDKANSNQRNDPQSSSKPISKLFKQVRFLFC